MHLSGCDVCTRLIPFPPFRRSIQGARPPALRPSCRPPPALHCRSRSLQEGELRGATCCSPLALTDTHNNDNDDVNASSTVQAMNILNGNNRDERVSHSSSCCEDNVSCKCHHDNGCDGCRAPLTAVTLSDSEAASRLGHSAATGQESDLERSVFSEDVVGVSRTAPTGGPRPRQGGANGGRKVSAPQRATAPASNGPDTPRKVPPPVAVDKVVVRTHPDTTQGAAPSSSRQSSRTYAPRHHARCRPQ